MSDPHAAEANPNPGFKISILFRISFATGFLEALESSPPVDEKYYYSLTGRFETLTHALDVLAEIERRKREQSN